MLPVLDPVKNVVTWPLVFASPGEKVTCIADGNPAPSIEWQRKDGGGEWTDVPNAKSDKIDAQLNNGTSSQLRCIAKNSVKNVKHSKTSSEFLSFHRNKHYLRS